MDGILVGKSKGDLPTNALPSDAQESHMMDVNQPLMSVSTEADAEFISIFLKDNVMICDRKKVDVILKEPLLLEGPHSSNGQWHINLYRKKKNHLLIMKIPLTHKTHPMI